MDIEFLVQMRQSNKYGSVRNDDIFNFHLGSDAGFLSQSKYFDQLSHKETKKTKKNKSKKRFVGLIEKNLKLEEYLNIYDRKLHERN